MKHDLELPKPNKVRQIVGRVRHETTVRALYAYMSERFQSSFEYEYSDGEKWWLMIAVTYVGDKQIDLNTSSLMCEACRAFCAGRKSMVD